MLDWAWCSKVLRALLEECASLTPLFNQSELSAGSGLVLVLVQGWFNL